MKKLTFSEILDLTLPLGGGLILRNQFATGEYKGKAYIYKMSKSWCTIYPKKCSNPEEEEHIHLKMGHFHFASLFLPEKRTPQLTFWQNKEDATPFLTKEKEAIKPPFVYVFPSFYDWSKEASPIQKNQEVFQSWLENNGKTFEIVPS